MRAVSVKSAVYAAGLSLLLSVGSAIAVPNLQLGILGATYNTTTETSVAASNTFTLYAFLTPDKKGDNTLSDTYYISAALNPQVGPANAALGSFSFAGQTVNATSGMVYGTPPLDANLASGGLQTHGVFPTFFKEFSFQFSSADHVSSFDVPTNPTLAGLDFSGTDAYYKTFTVDTTTLQSILHFDLYNEGVLTGQNINITEFAPFSHDAESNSVGSSGGGTASGGSGSAPEPASGSMAVMALGLLALGFRARNTRSTSR